jgi:uncharacterized protein YecE (DUF72 family)
MAQVWIGTSGFDYKEWKPGFYPEDLPHDEFLRYYATRLPSVELDNTFYRMPNASRIAAWSEATPEKFRFALKASRKITHQERLKLPSEALDYLIRTIRGLETRLGALLFQLPPFFRCEFERLAAFLQILPRDLPIAFEFRHESWFTDDVYRLLKEHGAALCINDGDEGTTPIEVTAPFTYLRLRRSGYPEALLTEWQERMRRWASEGIDVFAYIKHEENPDAPRIAEDFAAGFVRSSEAKEP